MIPGPAPVPVPVILRAYDRRLGLEMFMNCFPSLALCCFSSTVCLFLTTLSSVAMPVTVNRTARPCYGAMNFETAVSAISIQGFSDWTRVALRSLNQDAIAKRSSSS